MESLFLDRQSYVQYEKVIMSEEVLDMTAMLT